MSPYVATLEGFLRFLVHGGWWTIVLFVLVAAASSMAFKTTSRERDAEQQAALELDRW